MQSDASSLPMALAVHVPTLVLILNQYRNAVSLDPSPNHKSVLHRVFVFLSLFLLLLLIPRMFFCPRSIIIRTVYIHTKIVSCILSLSLSLDRSCQITMFRFIAGLFFRQPFVALFTLSLSCLSLCLYSISSC